MGRVEVWRGQVSLAQEYSPGVSFWEQLWEFQSSFLSSTKRSTAFLNFFKIFFILVPPNSMRMTRQPGEAKGKMVRVKPFGGMHTSFVLEVFFSPGVNSQNPCFCSIAQNCHLDLSGATECVPKAIRTHKRPSVEKTFWMITLES